mgnify:CR=1 FL=1|tara:strand:- start:149 stop:571 length:423 start_codon:yes stop_codon:yes gene_type:complete
MTWLAVKIFSDKVLMWCKKYWQILLGAGIAVGVMILTAGRKNELKRALEIANKKAQEDKDAMEESHRNQLEAEKARAEEQRNAAEVLARRISEIEKEYKVDSSNLSNRKKKKLKELLSNESGSTDVSSGLADIFGSNLKS